MRARLGQAIFELLNAQYQWPHRLFQLARRLLAVAQLSAAALELALRTLELALALGKALIVKLEAVAVEYTRRRSSW